MLVLISLIAEIILVDSKDNKSFNFFKTQKLKFFIKYFLI